MLDVLYQYRDDQFFNEYDTYTYYHSTFKKFYHCKAKKENGGWFSDDELKMKLTTVKVKSFKENFKGF